MSEWISQPLFGLCLSIGVYLLADQWIRRFRVPIVNPLVVAIILIILFLRVTGISYRAYNVGGSFLTLLITPATVALAIPLYQQFHVLKQHFYPIVAGILAGIVVNALLSVGIGYLFSLQTPVIASLLPKSVTTAIAVDLGESLGGINAITLAIVVSTGIIGSLVSKHVFRFFRINDPIAKGVALGSTSHAIGTAKAIEIGEIEGIISGLAICVNGLLTVALLPLLFRFCTHLF